MRSMSRLLHVPRRIIYGIRGFNGSVLIFNWEVNPRELRVERPGDSNIGTTRVEPLVPNRWYTLRWVVTNMGRKLGEWSCRVFQKDREGIPTFQIRDGLPFMHATQMSILKSFVVKSAD